MASLEAVETPKNESSDCANGTKEVSETGNLEKTSKTSVLEGSTCFNFMQNSEKKPDHYNERAAFYKKPISKNNYKLKVDFDDTPQEIRRQKLLEHQKKCRDALINEKRGLVETILDEENEENEEEMEEEEIPEEVEGMECEQIKCRRKKKHRYYSKLIMLSEWMLEVPQDLIDKWIMVPCPEGKRSLLIASRGFTKLYSRKGIFKCKFQSALPGGSRKNNKRDCTILDCFWSKQDKTYYILDVLAWANHEMVQCEVEFRFFWLQSKLNELNVQNGTKYKFVALPTLPWSEDLHELLSNLPESMSLDGLMFFHKEGHYMNGKTPLVTWLKPYMLPEVLGMSVPERFCAKPDNYIDFEHHILSVKEHEKQVLEAMQKQKRRWSKPEKVQEPEPEPEQEAME